MPDSPKTIVLSVSRGWFARLFLRSDVLSELLDSTSHTVIVMAPVAALDELRREVGDNDRVKFQPLHSVSRRSFLERVFLKGQYLFVHRPKLFRLWARTELQLSRTSFYQEIFDSVSPDLIVTASTGFHSLDDPPLIREARRRGIQTLCVVWSWDNLAMKGPLPSRPDRLAVWNEGMFREAIEQQHYSSDNVDITGVPRFDHYFRSDIYLSREEFFLSMELDPDRPLITIATAPMDAVADHRFLIKMVLAAADNGLYGTPKPQILCRVHPQEDLGFYKEFEDRDGVVFDYPGTRYIGRDWSPDDEEDRHMANTLKHTDVLINIASTVTIESAIVDTPAINVAFSTSEPERFRVNVLENHYGNHYRHIVESGASTIVSSEDELRTAIMDYLSNPTLRSDRRRELAERMCFKLDGKSGVRVANLIARIVNREGQVV